MTFYWTPGVKGFKSLGKTILPQIRSFLAFYSSDEEDFQAAVERQKQDAEFHPNLKRWRESVPTTYV